MAAVTTPRIPLVVPDVGPAELAEIERVFASGYIAQGPKVREFEDAVAAALGARHAFAMSSGTTALHLALVALGIGPGDEVLVPDFTFPATANVVMQQGATPVLVDIELDTFTIDVADLRRKVSPRSRAVMPVHTFGAAADLQGVRDVAHEANLRILEDAACAIGASFGSRSCGTIGDIGALSFHPRKSITTGEGGMILTNDDALAERVALLRSHGGTRSAGRVVFTAVGFNYRMSDINAAVGVAQMRRLPDLLRARADRARTLSSLIHDIPGIRVPVAPSWGTHTYQAYVVLLDEDVPRDAIIERMAAKGIETTLGTYALHAEPVFQRALGHAPGDLPRSYAAVQRSLTLPLYGRLTDSDLERIATALREALEGR